MLNIPSYTLFNKGTKKFIAKNAMKGLIPPKILKRNSPTLLTPLFNLGLQKKEINYVREKLNSNLEWSRFVKREEAQKYIQNSNKSGRQELVIWQCISFINWLENH